MPPTFLLFLMLVAIAGLAPVALLACVVIALSRSARRTWALLALRFASSVALVCGIVVYILLTVMAGPESDRGAMTLLLGLASFSCAFAWRSLAFWRRNDILNRVENAT